MEIDFEELGARLENRFVLGPESLHGPDHWARVMTNGLRIAADNGADQDVVRLFALFHDSCREQEGFDPQHGHRAADLVLEIQSDWFEVTEEQLQLLEFACRFHNDGATSDAPTIGACWDGDRLDLVRVNKIPDPEFLSTAAGIQMSMHGKFDGER